MGQKKIAWVQGAWLGDAEKTLDWYASRVRESVSSDTIVILPELVHTPYFPIEESPENFDWAIEKEHRFLTEAARLAKETRCVVLFPFFEKRNIGIYHNTVAVFDRDGSTAGIYRKSHIPDDPGFYEKFYFHPGDTGMRPVETSLGTLGILICWDQWFPEAARLAALAGAEMLVYPTAIGWDEGEPASLYADQLDSWKTCMRGHAVANGIFVAAVNRVGTEGNLKFWGNSFVAGPAGRVIHSCNETESGLFQLTVDTAEMETQRRMWPFFRDRRVDQYGDLLKRWID